MAETATQTAVQSEAATGIWAIDTVHSQVGFEVKHMGVATYRGRFNEFEGKVTTNDGALESVEGTIDIQSIDVRDDKLAGHLQSEDFFDTANYPKGYLRSTSVAKLDDDRYRIDAELTLRGVTNPVAIEVETTGPHPGMAGTTLGIAGSTEIDRTKYGISWNSVLENGAKVVSEQVRLVFEVEAILEA